jgi:hypothetical protein
LSKVIVQRLNTSLKVALSMSIGAYYGVQLERPNASLAAVTIAFLAGGAVSGINVVTCINRAAGT